LIGDVTVALASLIEDYDTYNPEGDNLKLWAQMARKEMERAKNELCGRTDDENINFDK
jgi:hypothetical protein